MSEEGLTRNKKNEVF